MTSILESVREGMTVRDRDGHDLGTVDFVHFSDEDPDRPGPETVTAGPDEARSRNSLFDIIAEAFRTHDVPDEMRQRLLRNGFLRIDPHGVLAAERYVMPDQIDRVSGNDVVLNTGKDELARRV